MNNGGLTKLLTTIKNAFSASTWGIVTPSISQTLYMVLLTTVLTGFFGLILGILLVLTDKDGLYPMPIFNSVVGAVINALRSMPSMIIIILTLPLSRLIIGISYGPKACIIALAITCIPMFARLVESSIVEVSKGKLEAAKAMGARNREIVFKIMLPEALPALVRNFTIAIIAIISTTALAGSFGAGGLGDVAVRFGYNRFRADILIASVLVLIVLVNAVQFLGERVARYILKRRHLI
ncbi:MAG: ABC transporter permease [Spirochaetaceae bacterium]|jgi:D-methionine transport system permease protein|nr:ABC transporter permease [Spirochaetaceae bacterium]